MNKQRRAEIAKLSAQLDDIKREVETLHEAETEYHDNMPESMQGGEKGEASQSAIDYLQEAIDGLEQAVDALNNAEGT